MFAFRFDLLLVSAWVKTSALFAFRFNEVVTSDAFALSDNAVLTSDAFALSPNALFISVLL